MPRQSEDFQRRMEYVLASRTQQQDEVKNPYLIKVVRLGGAAMGAVAVFFVLKGMALATSDRPLTAPPNIDAGIGARIQYWFAGDDPITRALATAIRMDQPTASDYRLASAQGSVPAAPTVPYATAQGRGVAGTLPQAAFTASHD